MDEKSALEFEALPQGDPNRLAPKKTAEQKNYEQDLKTPFPEAQKPPADLENIAKQKRQLEE